MKKKAVSTKRRKSVPGKEVALKGTVGRLPKSATAKHLAWKEVELEELTPLFHRQLIVGNGIMLARILLKKGSVVPWHSHANEQVRGICGEAGRGAYHSSQYAPQGRGARRYGCD